MSDPIRTVTVIVPSGYASAEEFAKDCGVEIVRLERAGPVLGTIQSGSVTDYVYGPGVGPPINTRGACPTCGKWF